MFPTSYFAPRYFPRRYLAQSGTQLPPTAATLTAVATVGTLTVFVPTGAFEVAPPPLGVIEVVPAP